MVQARVIGGLLLIVIVVIVIYALGIGSGANGYSNNHATSLSSSTATIAATTSIASTTLSTTVAYPTNVVPVVVITSPKNLSTVNGLVNVTANVIDSARVKQVQFYFGNNLTWASNSTPYYYLWNTTNATGSEYKITVKAYDYAGNVGQSSVLVDIGLVQHGK